MSNAAESWALSGFLGLFAGNVAAGITPTRREKKAMTKDRIFEVKINLEGDAFQGDTGGLAVRRILQDIADLFDGPMPCQIGLQGQWKCVLVDSNGNSCGVAQFFGRDGA